MGIFGLSKEEKEQLAAMQQYQNDPANAVLNNPAENQTTNDKKDKNNNNQQGISDFEKQRILNGDAPIITREKKQKDKLSDRLAMYDMILANIIAGESIIEPNMKLDRSQIHIGFSDIASQSQMTKYFMLTKLPDYIPTKFYDKCRSVCLKPGIRINFYTYCIPHKVDWNSPEMKNRMSVWRNYAKEHDGSIDVFSYRDQYKQATTRDRLIRSTEYLNEAEIVYKRSTFKATFIITVSAKRTEDALVNMQDCINDLKHFCSGYDIKCQELRVNMIDWIRAIGIFSMNPSKELSHRIARRVMTDDVLANWNSYKQGRVGTSGVPLGIDVLSGGPVPWKFKADPDGADNWLVSAATGGGKSYWVKTVATYLLADGFVGCVMDYEGDEYNPLADYIRAGNPKDVKLVSMGKSSNVYFDPCEIGDLTGDDSVDSELKENAVGFILAIFKIIVCGLDGMFTREQERIMSLAIQRMYDIAGVVDDRPDTWKRSEGLRLSDVYQEVVNMVEDKEFVGQDDGDLKHNAAVSIRDAASIYFEEGEAKYGVFGHPMSINELHDAKLIVFSFGMRGLGDSATDQTILALKQLSVAYINIQISNYCKYVKHCFNFKIWEEFQRWGNSRGSDEIISNAITGGRKRGDVNFIITNDLNALLNEDKPLNTRLISNIQNFAIGYQPDKDVREKFCVKFHQEDCLGALEQIAIASNKKSKEEQAGQKTAVSNNKYTHAFCLMLEDGSRAVVRVELPKSIADSDLFRTGVKVKEEG